MSDASARPRLPSALVTVSIVSHGQWHMVQPLLLQLEEFCHDVIATVVLTINIPEEVALNTNDFQFPIKCIRNSKPQGFGRNHNQAFQHCKTPWFLVLNPDIRLSECPINALLLNAKEESGLIAPRIIEPGRATPQSHRRLITPWELLSRRLTRHRPPVRPDWVPGMFMLVRQQAYADLGGFDERFFMYCEDHDLCLRLQLAGWGLYVEDNIIVFHEAQRLSHSSIRALRWHLASLIKTWTSFAFWRLSIYPRTKVNNPHR